MKVELDYQTPEIAIVHVGTNDLANRVSNSTIVNNLVNIIHLLKKSGTKYIIISGLVGRKGLRRQILELNSELKKVCSENKVTYIDNLRNISFSKQFMSRDRIHLNYNGLNKLLENFVGAINELFE